MTYQKPLVPLHQFANEILKDLGVLMGESPYGIMLVTLQEYYGESRRRVHAAVDLLEKVGKVVIAQNGNGSYFILPFDRQELLPIAKLSDLQRKVLSFLVKTCARKNTNRLKSSYFQLARMLNCSFGGLSTTIARLETLGYLKILEPSTQGHQNELLVELNSAVVGNPLFLTYKDTHTHAGGK